MIIFLIIAFLIITIGPRLLIGWTIKRHAVHRPDLQGTGGELARHLLNYYDLPTVRVESTQEGGDHYDPSDKTVRLSPSHFNGQSLSAVAIAAHEVGHALQDAQGDKWLNRRQKFAKLAITSDKVASVFFAAAPILGLLARVPIVFILFIVIGIALLSIRVVFNLITLPVEMDASFAKALPILRDGNYISEKDMPAISKVLRAAALTYVAGALISLVDVARWIRLLR